MTLPRQRISSDALRLVTAIAERNHDALEEFLEPDAPTPVLTADATNLLYDTWDHVYPTPQAHDWARRMDEAEQFARELGLL